MQGKIFTLEAIECGGKDVQSEKLFKFFKKLHKEVILVREPGGTPYGETLRAVLKHPKIAIRAINEAFTGHEDFPQGLDLSEGFEHRSPLSELFMFAAARAEFVEKIIKPARAKGKIIIVNRFYDSTTAYQGGGRFNHDPAMLNAIDCINMIATGGIVPDATLFLDISIEEMMKRRAKQTDKDAHFENTCDEKFYERVREGYLRIAKEEKRFVPINGEQEIEMVFRDIIRQLKILGQL